MASPQRLQRCIRAIFQVSYLTHMKSAAFPPLDGGGRACRAAQCGTEVFFNPLAGGGVEDVFGLKLSCDDHVNILILTCLQAPGATLCLLTRAARYGMK